MRMYSAQKWCMFYLWRVDMTIICVNIARHMACEACMFMARLMLTQLKRTAVCAHRHVP